MEAETFKQEMPPVGGYRPLNFERTFAKRFLSFGKCTAIILGCGAVWLYLYRIKKRRRFVLDIEERSGTIALEACLFAERDREFLKQLRRNRDEEAELMKNVPGWVVGGLYDTPVYYTRPPEEVINPSVSEYYIHTRFKYFTEFFQHEMYR